MNSILKYLAKWFVFVALLISNKTYSQLSLTDSVNIPVFIDDPRREIMRYIENGRTDILLVQAGQLHGHICPGLSMGVMAACYAMNELKKDSAGLEDLTIIIETRSCVSDGVEFVTGCSFGKGSLIFKDVGKTAVTVINKNGKGIRLCSRHESPDIIKASFPAFQEYYRKVVIEKSTDPEMIAAYKKASFERNFGVLHMPIDKLFTIQHVQVELPEILGHDESVVCSVCGESVKKSKTIEIGGKPVCFQCSDTSYGTIDSKGIHAE